MRIIDTAQLNEDSYLSETDKLWVYNGLDCCVTDEVLRELLPQLDSNTASTYDFSRELFGPILEMNMRGMRVDEDRRQEVIKEFEEERTRIANNLERMVVEGIGVEPINPNSPAQVGNLLYDVMGLPEQRKRGTAGTRVRTADEDALIKLQGYYIARPLIQHILAVRVLTKRLSTLRTGVDPDGRMRTNFNIAGTNTSRLSSSLGDFGEGGNMQNWEDRLREIFIPDEGMVFGNIDLGQADARNIAAVCWNIADAIGVEAFEKFLPPELEGVHFEPGTYLNACESGDLHTSVARMCWPSLGWTDDPKYNKKVVAEQKFYRHHSYRDSSKKLGHGTNYLVTPRTAEQKTMIPAGVVLDFQHVYFRAFPEIKALHGWVGNELKEHGYLVNLFDRKRYFFGRLNEDETLRQGVAYLGQSPTAEEINRGILNLWYTKLTQLLLQVHDSIMFQVPEDKVDVIMPRALEALRIPITLAQGREFIVPPEAQIGLNWGKQQIDETGKVVRNERGLRNYS